jgi:hypothetical protein
MESSMYVCVHVCYKIVNFLALFVCVHAHMCDRTLMKNLKSISF